MISKTVALSRLTAASLAAQHSYIVNEIALRLRPLQRVVRLRTRSGGARQFALRLLQPLDSVLEREFPIGCVVEVAAFPRRLNRLEPVLYVAAGDGSEQILGWGAQWIAERVRNVLRQVGDTSLSYFQLMIGKLNFQRALQDIGEFVFKAVDMQFVPIAGPELRVKHVDRATGLLLGQLVALGATQNPAGLGWNDDWMQEVRPHDHLLDCDGRLLLRDHGRRPG